MATDQEQSPAPSSESLEARYETSGVSIKGLAIFVVCLLIVAGAIHLGVWFLYTHELRVSQLTNHPSSALTDQQFVEQYNLRTGGGAKVSTIAPPPAPRLQPTPGVDPQNGPEADLSQMYEDEDAVFRQMGWTIDPATHRQLKIPPQVIADVIAEESAARQGEHAGNAQGGAAAKGVVR